MVHSRYGAVLFSLLMVSGVIYAFFNANTAIVATDNGFGLPSASQLFTSSQFSLIASLSLNILIVLLMIAINKTFNLLKSLTAAHATVFMVLQLAIPDLSCGLYDGTVMCLVALVCSELLFSTYCDTANTPRVFLIFFIISFCAFFQYAFLMLLPVFFLGCAQMRILKLRTILAAGIGVITPAWLLFGFNIISIENVAMPHIESIFAAVETREAIYFVAGAAVTVFICVVMWMLNLMRVIGFNSQIRAYNGFFATLSFFTIAMMLIDYTNFPVYVPLLNCCTAFQAAHFLAARQSRYGYIWFLGIAMIYITLYLWGIWMF